MTDDCTQNEWMLKQEWECNKMEIKISHQKKCSMQSHPNAFRSLFESSKYWRKRVICELHVRAIKIVMQNVIWTFYSKSFKNWNWKWNWIETDKALGYLCQIFASFFFLSRCVSEREMASQKREYFRVGWRFSIPILFVKHVPFRCLCKSGIFAPTPFCC